jgi:glycosyltransferase involved in cell wall biosynthesis
MAWTGMCLTEYVRRGQDKQLLSDALKILPHLVPAPIQDNSWSATHAESLIASGLHEASVLRRDYPTTKRIDICHFGSAITTAPVSPELFINTFGVQDFVLCVGRIENRKNQLMLMHALEESDVPLVLLAGAGSYEVDYADAVRQFQRRGETVIIDELSPEMIASAYAASRVHALPSWYELPGLVSLEAALYGTNVVATKNGTAADYFGPLAFYCEPHNPESIRNAVEAAYSTPKSEPLKQPLKHCAERFTWQRCAEELLQIYQQILGRNSHPELPPPIEAHP